MMLILVACFTVAQFCLAIFSPRRLVYFTLVTGAIPVFWSAQTHFTTPLGTLDVAALRLFGLCIAAGIVLAANLNQVMLYIARFKWHLLFIFVAGLSITYAPSPAYGFRMLAKLVGPLIIMLVVAVAIQTQEHLRTTARTIIASGVILCCLAYLTRALGMHADTSSYAGGAVGLGPPGMGPPVFAAHMLGVSMLALAWFITERRVLMLGITALFALSLLATLQRTSAAAMLLGFSLILFFGTRGFTRLLLPAMSVVALPLLLIFNEGFRRRMFFNAVEPEKILSDPASVLSGIDSSGRFTLWADMMERFYAPDPMLGSGLGATQNYLYEYSAAGIGVVHSEYVRLLCEMGLLGLCLFVVVVMTYLVSLSRGALSVDSVDARRYSLAAIGAIIGYIGYMATDNSFDYVNQFGAYVFSLVAMAFKAKELCSVEARAEIPVPQSLQRVAIPNLMR